MRALLDGFLFGHGLLALAAAALTWATGALLHQRLPPAVPLLAGAATLALYNLDGLMPYKRAQPASTRRERWLRAHPRLLGTLAAAGGLVATPLAVRLLADQPRAWGLLAPLAALATMYSVPVVPGKGGQWRPLRDTPGLKGVLIAAVWAGVTGALPVLLGTPTAPAGAALLVLRRFLWILALTLVFDLRDLVKDARSGTPSLAVLLGERRTKWLAWVLLGALALVVPPATPPAAGAGLLAAVAAGAAVVAGARPGRSDYYYSGLVDGVVLLPAVAEWLTSGFWLPV